MYRTSVGHERNYKHGVIDEILCTGLYLGLEMRFLPLCIRVCVVVVRYQCANEDVAELAGKYTEEGQLKLVVGGGQGWRCGGHI